MISHVPKGRSTGVMTDGEDAAARWVRDPALLPPQHGSEGEKLTITIGLLLPRPTPPPNPVTPTRSPQPGHPKTTRSKTGQNAMDCNFHSYL
ncbi:hypothetical protein Trco_005136 [Trichoderma cornu-damae]|uniref:Uncharacterized protein n=1 Tax=Trichoderma cornu-damae TaxID=654480 RepID=A0A9P8QNM9_9HYPO|nr:hypothetical protein Trco_005136 [Trichoderma cornu-damae]